MTNVSDITVRQSKLGDVRFLMEFVADNDWDTSMYEHWAYIRIDPNYLLVAVDSFENPVGFGGISQSAPGIMYLGNFIVRKDLRRKGIGRLIWKSMLERAGDQNIVLDGGSEMADWYMEHGFPFHTFKILFHLVTVTREMKKSIQSKYETMTLSDDMWPSLMEYDKYVYPSFDRERILRAWFAGDQVRVVVAKDVGKIVGYGSIHKMPNNHYGIRNVFADNEAVIETILHDMLADLPEGTIVHFTLVNGKPLPKYIQHSVYLEETAQRMFSKFKIETNTDKMWLATAHVL